MAAAEAPERVVIEAKLQLKGNEDNRDVPIENKKWANVDARFELLTQGTRTREQDAKGTDRRIDDGEDIHEDHLHRVHLTFKDGRTQTFHFRVLFPIADRWFKKQHRFDIMGSRPSEFLGREDFWLEFAASSSQKRDELVNTICKDTSLNLR